MKQKDLRVPLSLWKAKAHEGLVKVRVSMARMKTAGSTPYGFVIIARMGDDVSLQDCSSCLIL
jgi:hypothetical protein